MVFQFDAVPFGYAQGTAVQLFLYKPLVGRFQYFLVKIDMPHYRQRLGYANGITRVRNPIASLATILIVRYSIYNDDEFADNIRNAISKKQLLTTEAIYK
jgi:hypothetical protein